MDNLNFKIIPDRVPRDDGHSGGLEELGIDVNGVEKEEFEEIRSESEAISGLVELSNEISKQEKVYYETS